MRVKTRVQAAVLPLELPAQATHATCAALVQALLKHLLYARCHIPYLYDQLLQQALEEQRAALEEQQCVAAAAAARGRQRRARRRLKKSDNLRLQFLQRAEALLDTIAPELFSTDQPTRCYILLGASTSRPREAYELVLPAVAPPGTADAFGLAAQRDDYACRVLLRQLITNTPDLPEGAAAQRPGKVYFLIQAPAGQSPPPGFQVKPNFKLGMRKGVHVTFSLGGAALLQQTAVAAAQQAQREEDDMEECTTPVQQQQQQCGRPGSGWPAAEAEACEGVPVQPATVWLQSKWVLRGLKSHIGSID